MRSLALYVWMAAAAICLGAGCAHRVATVEPPPAAPITTDRSEVHTY